MLSATLSAIQKISDTSNGRSMKFKSLFLSHLSLSLSLTHFLPLVQLRTTPLIPTFSLKKSPLRLVLPFHSFLPSLSFSPSRSIEDPESLRLVPTIYLSPARATTSPKSLELVPVLMYKEVSL